MRCTHEASLHDQNAFVTLTYSPENLPPGGCLRHSDFQDFMRRLRQTKGVPDSIKYYMCGEYGDPSEDDRYVGQTGRPHYHALIFGYDWPDKEFMGKREHGHEFFGSELLTKQWQHGHTELGSVTFESAAYVAGYVSKKLKESNDGYIDRYHVIDTHTGEYSLRPAEYCKMSRGGPPRKDGTQQRGIAAEWWDRYRGDLEKDFITMQGKRMRPPKYYDRLEEQRDADSFQRIKDKRREQSLSKEHDDLKRGREKEKCKQIRFNKRSKRSH